MLLAKVRRPISESCMIDTEQHHRQKGVQRLSLLDERYLSGFCCDCWIAYSKADSSIALISSSEKFTYVSADELFVCA